MGSALRTQGGDVPRAGHAPSPQSLPAGKTAEPEKQHGPRGPLIRITSPPTNAAPPHLPPRPRPHPGALSFRGDTTKPPAHGHRGLCSCPRADSGTNLTQQTYSVSRKSNWPSRIRTWINGSKVRCPAIGRRASGLRIYTSSGPGGGVDMVRTGVRVPCFRPSIILASSRSRSER
jgi:hypothetical protein